MKKNILIIILILTFLTQNSFAIKEITSAELFEIIKTHESPKYQKIGNPLKELAHYIQAFTSITHGIITKTELSIIKALLYREGYNGDNPYNLFYEDLFNFLDQKFPLDLSNQTCTICQSEITPVSNSLILSCNHVFCYNCLFEHYTKHNLKKDDAYIKCPNCRKNLDDSVIALFITDCRYKQKLDATIKEYEQEEFQEIILRIILLGNILAS